MCHERARASVKEPAGTTAVVFWTCKIGSNDFSAVPSSSSPSSSGRVKSRTFGFCANAGDSRAVLSVSGRARRLTVDHTAGRPEECERIARAGGRVEFGHLADGDGDGVLKVSRGIGNFDLEPSFICDPFVAPPVLLSAEGASLRSKRRISETEEGDHGVGPDAAAVSDDGDGGAVEFLLLASDGLWDVFEDQEAVDFVRARLCAGDSAETCAARLTKRR